MQKPTWIYAFASVIGNSHILENTACQDACGVKHSKNFTISVLADGAGSCQNADLGAKKVCELALFHFENEIEKQDWHNKKQMPTQEHWHSLAKEILLLVRNDLENYSQTQNLPFKSLSSTIIAVIASENGLLLTHIGDGRAGYCNQKDEWEAMMTPFHGEQANETVFITSNIWHDEIVDFYVESKIITQDIKAFCLLSDGAEKTAFECNLYDSEKEIYYDPNLPYKDFFHKNVHIHLPNLQAEGKSQEEINQLWEKFLTSGNEKLKNEPDDKTIVLAVKI